MQLMVKNRSIDLYLGSSFKGNSTELLHDYYLLNRAIVIANYDILIITYCM